MNTRLLSVVACGVALTRISTGQNADSIRENAPAAAQRDAFAAAASESPKLPPINFQILERQEIQIGDRKIIQNRVAPPVLPEPRAVVAQPPAPLSAESVQTALRREGKKSEVLFLSATVYDRAVTQLRWFGEAGECRAFSNIDFNFLSGLGEIETEDTVYSILMGLENESRAVPTGQDRGGTAQIPLLSQFSPARAEYFVVGDKAKPATAEALAGMDALHRYYDAHRVKLTEDYRKREAARVEREVRLKAHPPVPQDTVINFWPADAKQVREMQAKEGKR